ncbi:MAG: CDP-alcohol phosphatidyltransferase family protein [Candidatus Eisenbacteria bacterium]|uniref:CDP-alcohol phosphatidyltransferase family protein n=1 Tax=Eiseniibacteriota bacterium TaxID=2212470 RepID=A0A538TEW4_UNCEI|nr:MAG: CDP-alcohol phosphatidyltransferase family protein [Candidatus Eisenbacteria bacterium]
MPRSDLLGEIRREGYTLGAIWRFARGSLARVSRGLPQHPELVRPIAALALVLFTLQFGAALLLSVHVGRSAGVSYLVASSLMLLFVSFWVLTHVGLLLGSRDGQLVIRVPVPIGITMLRFVSIPAIVILIHEGRWEAVVWIFVASAFTDVLDGVLARALRAETRVGALLDPLTDVAFNSCVFIALLEARVVPWWVTALMLIRYALLVGGTVYLYFFYGPVRIQPTLFGKLTGFLTTLLLGLLLLGLSSWSETARRSMKEVFDVGLGVMGLATIIQVVFIGLANRSVGGEPVEVPEIQERPAKVVGEIRSR